MKIADLHIDAGTQVRVRAHEETVSEYAEAMQAGSQFPPIVVFHDGSHYFVGDGFHRLLAAVRIGLEEIAADIRKGTASDALWFALGANKENGLRMTSEDKKHAILLALEMWPDKSSHLIAEQIGCAQSFVLRLKNQVIPSVHLAANPASMEEKSSEKPINMPARVTGKDGKRYPAKKKSAMTKDEKVEKIGELSAKGFIASQIAEEIGISRDRVVHIAKEAAIKLPDSIMGRTRRIDVNRIISETVKEAESFGVGLELIDGRLDSIDISRINGWILSLRGSIRAVNRLIRTLERTASHARQ